ncbi:MAG: hypothetical protein V9G20_11040 [Candidatus Promineifilaceae bacterium]
MLRRYNLPQHDDEFIASTTELAQVARIPAGDSLLPKTNPSP